MLWTTLVLFPVASMMLVTLIATNSVTEAFSNFPWIFVGSAIFFAHRVAGSNVPFQRRPSVQSGPLWSRPFRSTTVQSEVIYWKQPRRSSRCGPGKIMEDLLLKSHEFSKMFHKFPRRNEGWNMTKYDDILFMTHMYVFPIFPQSHSGTTFRKLHVGLDLWVPSLYQPSPLDAVVFQLSRPTSWNKIQKAWTSTCRSLRGRQPLGSAAG